MKRISDLTQDPCRFQPAHDHVSCCAGKDRLVKYWDVDKFQLLLELPGHQAEVWAVVVSSLGDFIITAGHDRSFRRWERTEEPFFIEEEQERRLESLFEADAEVLIALISLVIRLCMHAWCGVDLRRDTSGHAGTYIKAHKVGQDEKYISQAGLRNAAGLHAMKCVALLVMPWIILPYSCS